jgi:4-hydroxybenzoate polyprenyltransferase
VKKYASLVVFAHTVFALPFALISFTLAYQTFPLERPLLLLIKVLGCMVTARNSAMSFNRLIDRHIDAHNERTKNRELPSGKLSPRAVTIFFIINATLFVACAGTINTLCLCLAFPTLVLLCGYSYTKRFTWLSHFVLGLSLAIAPAATWIAVTGTLSLSVLCLSLLVVLWVSGFDILYALPDHDHDRAHNLFSIPQRFGISASLWISGALHLLVVPVMVAFGLFARLGGLYLAASLIFTTLLIYQHAIVRPHRLTKLNHAFFTANGLASILFALLTIWELLGL